MAGRGGCPGFNQRFIGEISADGKTIRGPVGMGHGGRRWWVEDRLSDQLFPQV